MASSFLEDLLGKKIDENEVSAMKGSLESQLASSTIPKSNQIEVKQDAKTNNSSSHQAIITTQSAKQSSPVPSQTANLRPGIAVPRVHTLGNPITTTVIHIAPRPSVTTAVPLAPRPNTMTVLSPGTGGRYVTTMINAADLLNRNVNVINASQILTPRMVSGAVTVPGSGQVIAPRILQALPPRLAGVAAMASPQAQNSPGVQISQDSKTGRITLTQAPVHSAIVSAPVSGAAPSAIPLTRTTIAQVRTNTINTNSIPGTIAFQVPSPVPVHLISNQRHSPVPISNTNATEVRTVSSTSGSPCTPQITLNTNVMKSVSLKPAVQVVNSQPATVMGNPTVPSQVTIGQPQVKVINAHLEAVKEQQASKLKNFFNNLIRLASEKSPEVGLAVKDLIQKVMEGKLTEEDFAAKLLTTLNSGPQPNLVGFLKKALPMLRAGNQVLQLIPQPQQIQISALGAPKLLPHPHSMANQPNRIVPQPRHTTPQATQIQSHQPHKVQLTHQQQMLMQKQSIVKLTPAQQLLLQREQQLGTHRVLIAASSAGGAVGTQIPTSTRGLVMVQARPGVKMAVTQFRPQVTSSPGLDKAKHKLHAGISSSGDDDINDVTSMAGVNLMEESQRILAINSELLSAQTRSCRDELFLNNDPLQKKLEALVKKHGLSNIPQDVCGLISHATQERLRDILEKLSTISLNRPENYRDDPRYEGSLETKAQIRVFEQIDEVERKKRELREREVLMRAAKSRSRQEDPEQARLKEKAKQLQQEEEDIIRKREANNTALAAIGPRKKRKLEEALEGAASSNQGTTSSSHGTKFNASESQFGSRPQRTRRVTLKDLVFVLEQEKESTKSPFLYKALLK